MTDAHRAAVEVAGQLGLAVDEPVLVQETNNTILWLTPHEIIAKVGTHADSGDALIREHAIASELAARDAPLAPPLPGGAPVRHAETGYVVTLWCRLDHDPSVRVSELAVGASLRSLHAALELCSVMLPSFRLGLERARRALADDSRLAALNPADRTFLRTAFDGLLTELDDRTLTERALHGEPTTATSCSPGRARAGSTSRAHAEARWSGISRSSPRARDPDSRISTATSCSYSNSSTAPAWRHGAGFRPASQKCAGTANTISRSSNSDGRHTHHAPLRGALENEHYRDADSLVTSLSTATAVRRPCHTLDPPALARLRLGGTILSMTAFSLPVNLSSTARRNPNGGLGDWLVTLPAVIKDLAERWSVTIGEPYQPGGECSWVAPAVGRSGEKLVLKVGWQHDEARYEPDALRAWDGHGAVRLHAAHASDQTSALLLERCEPGTTLAHAAPTAEHQDIVVAELLQRLWIKPGEADGFRPLQIMCDRWAAEFEEAFARSPRGLDLGVAREGMSLFRSLPATADRTVLLCTDLHAENILAARREPWLVIDPKPYVGDPAYDVLQHMLNCRDRVTEDPIGLAHRMAHLANLDPDRVTSWLFARCVQESIGSPQLAAIAAQRAPR